MSDFEGACIHRNPGGEDELYNVGLFPVADKQMWIDNYPIWFPGDYLVDIVELSVDHDIMPTYYVIPWIGWRLGSNGKWYDPTYTPPVDPTDPTDPTETVNPQE